MSVPVSIAVIGSINLDIVASGAALPRAGETVTGASLAYHPGGKGANQALAARRLGAQVAMFGAVGADGAADQALALVRAGGVDLAGIKVVTGAPTGVALIVVDDKGENQIVVAPGANTAVTPARISEFDLGRYDAILCQLEIPTEAIETLVATAAGFVAINLAPAQYVSAAILTRADLIIVNETEAAFYGDALHQGSGLVVITLGGEGAVMYQGGTQVVKVGSPNVTPVDTTGAGDTFVGALVVALLEGQSHQDAMHFACAAGAAATLTAGAQPSLPDRAMVLALMGATS